MKRRLLVGAAVILLVLVTGVSIALAVGTASVSFSGPTTVEVGKTYTYNYTLQVNSACAANANIVVGGAFEKLSGGSGIFYDSIEKGNTTATLYGSVTVRVRSDVNAGTPGTITLGDNSKGIYLVYQNGVLQTPVEFDVTGSLTAAVAPTATATAIGYDSVRLTWNAMTGATGYEIFRSVGVNGGLTLYDTTTQPSFLDTGLATGTPYYYRIRPYRMNGEAKVYGGLTGVLSATPTLSTVTNPVAATTEYNVITLTWNTVPGATGYEVFRSVGVNGGLTLYKTITEASYQDTGLPSGTTCYYRIRAYRTVGSTKIYGGLTGTAFSTTKTLGTVINAKAATTDFNVITLTWNAVTDASGYEIFRSVGVNGGLTLYKTVTDATYVDTGLLSGTTYYYRIRAYRTVGETKVYGGLTGTIYSTTRTLGTVMNAKAVLGAYDSIDVTWNAVVDATGYEIFRSMGVNGGLTLYDTTTVPSFTDTNLTTGTPYYYRMRAYRLVGESKVYGGLTGTVSATPTLGTVVNATAVAVNPVSIGLTWNAVPGATGYEIFRSVGVNGGLTLYRTITEVSYTDTGLVTNTSHYYRIRAYRMVGETKVYGGLTGTVSAMPILGTITNPKAVASDPVSIDLTWNAVPDATGYEIFRSVGVDGGLTLYKTTTDPSYTDTGLTTGVACYYRMRAYWTSGDTTVFGGLTGTVSAMPILGTITNPKAVASDPVSIDLTWNAVPDATGYEIFRSVGVDGGLTLYKTTTDPSYTDTGLTTGVACYYRMRAYWTSGDTTIYGGLTGTISATPALGTVTNAKATASSSARVDLAWNAVSGATGYEIFRSVGVNGGLTLYKTTTDPSYADMALTKDVIYYYRIRAYWASDGTTIYGGLTNTVSAKAI